ncbi:MAG: helix-turn-helix domain-containing protein [Firmicutes bacterium]|nr:helix-turn-helix domain-containing protein [Bacillota bacterium]
MKNKIDRMNYFCVIPAKILQDKKLPDKAKILYGFISGLSNKKGYCYAENEYLEDLLDCSQPTLSRLFSALEKGGHIKREVLRDANQQVVERRIYLSEAYMTLVVAEENK